MTESKKQIVIWGAGKIGRGFVADIFNKAGYELTFVDASKELVEKLKNQGKYTLYNIPGLGEEEKVVIDNFSAYCTDDKEGVSSKLMQTQLMAIVVFPNAFEDTAKFIAGILEEKAEKCSDEPFDILVCANMFHPTVKLNELLRVNLTNKGIEYLEQKVGLIETLVMRIAIEPTEEMKKEDELVVLTNGYPEMPADKTAFKGQLPVSNKIKYSEKIMAEEVRKMYTYNMIHAVFAYIGSQKGFQYVVECTQDEEVREIAIQTLNEVSEGLQKEFGFTPEEMEIWNKRVMKNMSNPILKDALNRVGGDPVRKLNNKDRLVGPALLCRKNGIMPYYLAKAIAGAFNYNNTEDASCKIIQEFIKENGIKAAIRNFCGLDKELELIQLINEHYEKAVKGAGIKENIKRVKILKTAYEYGFKYEKTIKGCAQCALAAFFEITGKTEPILFQAASGLSGGIAITGDGSCGGYTGGVMLMGTYAGRRLEQIPVDGDKIAQYKSYEMAQKLHDKYMEAYGSVTCADIHKEVFGKAYCLRTKEVRDEFEEAGAHRDKCTTVIAMACAWIADLMIDEEFIRLD